MASGTRDPSSSKGGQQLPPPPPPSHDQPPVLSPNVYNEELPTFDTAFQQKQQQQQPQLPSMASAFEGSNYPISRQQQQQYSLASVASALSGSSQLSAQQAKSALHQIQQQLSGTDNIDGYKSGASGGKAAGIGGLGRGTAATGELGAQDDFESIEDLRSQVKELETDYNAKHTQTPLSGRIIHVSHYIPFVIKALAEVDFERRKEEQISATATVAALAAAARARKAARQAEIEAKKREAEAEAARNEARAAQAKGQDPSSNKATPGRKLSTIGTGPVLFDGAEIERRLAENQARSRLRGGRRAWMMTPVVDDDDDDDEAISEKDAYTPIGSRRPSRMSFGASRMSFSNMMDDSPRVRYGAGVSDFEPSPAATPPRPPQEAAPPQWVLAPRRGHTALNSGIRSLCKTHRQTFIGWPGDVHFALQARKDERKDPSETTAQERREIEGVLRSLDDPNNWKAQEAPVLGADPTMSADGAPPMSKVPGPLMNGADPIAPEGAGSDARGSKAEAENGIKYVPVWLDYEVAHGHYEGYCKTTLWPLFHYLLWQDVPGDQNSWEDYSWEAYYAANLAFADKIASEYKPGDVVWIHDYHLLLVPFLLRKSIPDAHIGLFVHAPFPSSEIFRCLPRRREIIEGMLGADLACFQAFSYARHFLSSCIRVCGYEASANSVESSSGHVTHISYNPIGIDANKIEKDARASDVAPKIQAIREMYKGKRIIIGRDKLDVVRGVVQKLQAYQKLLEEWPEWRDKVVLIQITAPSLTDSPMLERQVSELVSNINGQFGSLNHTPCVHYHQQLLREEYFALLSMADMALITSVRDGMNTTSMEYILANTGHSPLILSEFTGTAGRMRAALQVNPWNTYGVAKAIDYGLRMGVEEREARYEESKRQIVNHTSHHWAITLVKQIMLQLHSDQAAHFTPALDRSEMKKSYDVAGKRLLLLDYDGTLTPIVKDPAAAVPHPRLLDALEKLSSDPKNVMYIISGRDSAFLYKHLGQFTNIGFSAEHGGYLKEPGSEEWHNLTESLDMSWMDDIRQVFEYYTERTSGSSIEQKRSAITWHYRNADPDFGAFQAKECQAHLDNFAAQEGYAVEIMIGKKNIEVRPLAVNKGEIVKRITYSHSDAEFVFCAGDDRTDEDMMKFFCTLTPVNGEAPLLCNSGGGSATQAASGRSLSLPRTGDRKNAKGEEEKTTKNNDSITLGASWAPAEEQDASPLIMSAPTPLSSSRGSPVLKASQSPKQLQLTRKGIFTTAVGAAGKKTLAQWHLDGPQNVISVLALMADMETVENPVMTYRFDENTSSGGANGNAAAAAASTGTNGTAEEGNGKKQG